MDSVISSNVNILFSFVEHAEFGIWFSVNPVCIASGKGFLKMRYLLSRPLLLIEYVTNYTGIGFGHL